MGERKRLIVRCAQDISSVNIVDRIVAAGGWEDAGSDGYASYKRKGNEMIMEIPDLHINVDGLDRRAAEFGFRPDVVIFPSEHASSSGMPALTVHPLGNYDSDDSLGGRKSALVPSCPDMMSDALRLIKEKCQIPEFNICYEATHHGPYLETPAFFIEIGSDERHWGRADAAELQASVVESIPESNNYPVMIGIGGGHYTPRFTELALFRKVNFGHFIPNYRTEGKTDEEIAGMIRMAAERTGTRTAFLHRKSMNGAKAARMTSLAESVGVEVIKTDCFEPLDGN